MGAHLSARTLFLTIQNRCARKLKKPCNTICFLFTTGQIWIRSIRLYAMRKPQPCKRCPCPSAYRFKPTEGLPVPRFFWTPFSFYIPKRLLKQWTLRLLRPLHVWKTLPLMQSPKHHRCCVPVETTITWLCFFLLCLKHRRVLNSLMQPLHDLKHQKKTTLRLFLPSVPSGIPYRALPYGKNTNFCRETGLN